MAPSVCRQNPAADGHALTPVAGFHMQSAARPHPLDPCRRRGGNAGVVRVLTGEELRPPVAGGQLSLPAKWRTHVHHAIHNPQQPMLAVGNVRHVGEALAVVVVAGSHDQALDAAERVTVDIEPLAAVVDA
jgi:CO/xanthine dehydrogenase Mo-binding subunit